MKDSSSLTSASKELRDRVEAERKRLEARIAELKADGRQSAREEREQLEHRLGEIRKSVANGWENLTESAAKRLNALFH